MPSFAEAVAAMAVAEQKAQAAAQGEGKQGGNTVLQQDGGEVAGGGKQMGGGKKGAAGEDIEADMLASAKQAMEKLKLRHTEGLFSTKHTYGLLSDDWESSIVWDPNDLQAQQQTGLLAEPVVWDLNDPYMVFESTQAAAYAHADAIVKPPPPKV